MIKLWVGITICWVLIGMYHLYKDAKEDSKTARSNARWLD